MFVVLTSHAWIWFAQKLIKQLLVLMTSAAHKASIAIQLQEIAKFQLWLDSLAHLSSVHQWLAKSTSADLELSVLMLAQTTFASNGSQLKMVNLFRQEETICFARKHGQQ